MSSAPFAPNAQALIASSLSLTRQVGTGAAANPFNVGTEIGWYRDANDDVFFVDIAGEVTPAGGSALNTFTATAALSAGNVVFASSANHVNKAKADSGSTMPAIGILPADIGSAAAGQVQTSGIYTTTGLTAGSVYYVSDATAGAITATALSTAGHTQQIVGVALSTTQLLLAFGTPAQVGTLDGATVNIGGTSATAVNVGRTGQSVGFFGITAAARPGAFTLTYSTATHTHSNPVAVAITDSTGGTPGSEPFTLASITTGGSAADQGPTRDGLAKLAKAVNDVITDLANTKQVLNGAISDLKTLGLLQ